MAKKKTAKPCPGRRRCVPPGHVVRKKRKPSAKNKCIGTKLRGKHFSSPEAAQKAFIAAASKCAGVGAARKKRKGKKRR